MLRSVGAAGGTPDSSPEHHKKELLMSLNLDTIHSSIEFSVRHMGLATVRGRFEDFTVDAEVNEQGEPTRVKAVIDAASINTGTADRDAHLRSADFFDVENYPSITFESTAIERRGDKYVIEGDHTMRGVTKPASFEAERSEEHTSELQSRPHLVCR